MNHEQLQNCRNLLAVGQRVLDEQLPLDFRRWFSECGTYACLGGWYQWETDAIGSDDTDDMVDWFADCALDHFGINTRQRHILFDAICLRNHDANCSVPAAYKELERRMKVLRSIIARGSKGLRAQGMPEEVRSIFNTQSGEVRCRVSIDRH